MTDDVTNEHQNVSSDGLNTNNKKSTRENMTVLLNLIVEYLWGIMKSRFLKTIKFRWLVFLIVGCAHMGLTIDCFKCVSIGGDNEACDDPFHNNGSVNMLESPCLGGRKGRDGLFPATACIKLAGIYADTGISMTVRGCALDSGTLTTDTEIIRMSHCGGFYFENEYVRGCVQSCDDADACNESSQYFPSVPLIIATILSPLW